MAVLPLGLELACIAGLRLLTTPMTDDVGR